MIALKVISASEIAKVIKNWHYTYPLVEPEKFKKLLWDLGLDTNKPWEIQEDILHRNAFGEVRQCTRYVGVERIDRTWIESGYASREAKDIATGSKLLMDIKGIRYVNSIDD